jgi:hypothetical protein
MPRLSLPSVSLLARPTNRRTFILTRSLLAEEPKSNQTSGTSVSTGPGYEGRGSNDHAVNRTEQLDPQSDAAHSSMKQRDKGEEGSQGVSQNDERNSNKRAKEENPEAPGPVLGMNDERGGVSDPKESGVEVEDRAQGYAS